jgi:hypothetical protein
VSRATFIRHFQERLGRSASDLLADIRMTVRCQRTQGIGHIDRRRHRACRLPIGGRLPARVQVSNGHHACPVAQDARTFSCAQARDFLLNFAIPAEVGIRADTKCGNWSFTPRQAAVNLRSYLPPPPFTTGVTLAAASPTYSGLFAGLAPFLRPKKAGRDQKPASHRPRRGRIYWDLDWFVSHGLRTLA